MEGAITEVWPSAVGAFHMLMGIVGVLWEGMSLGSAELVDDHLPEGGG